MIKAIAVDMDGTFLDTNKQFDRNRFETIFKELIDKNIKFVAASGNQFAKLKSILEIEKCSLYLKMEQSSIKVINFTIIEVLISIFFKSCKLFKFKSKDKQFDYLWRKSAYILKETSEAFKQDARTYYHQLIEIDSLQTLPDDDYVKIAFNINRQTHPDLDEKLALKFKEDIKLVSSGRDSIDVIMPNMTKGQALSRLLKEWQMPASHLMAFGDANNDMLELAEHSYVMANSEDKSLFNIARHVAPSNDEQGVLSTIENVVLGYSNK